MMTGSYFLGEGVMGALNPLQGATQAPARGAGFIGTQMPTAPSWVK